MYHHRKVLPLALVPRSVASRLERCTAFQWFFKQLSERPGIRSAIFTHLQAQAQIGVATAADHQYEAAVGMIWSGSSA
jgi:hypothetical protein